MNAMMLAALGAATVAAAGPVQGSISGPITAVHGSTFTVKTSLSPTGSSKVTVDAKTQLEEQGAGTFSDLVKGTCVTAVGTKHGTAIAAQRIGIVPSANGRCGAGFRRGGPRPRIRAVGPPGASRGRSFTPPAGFGFAVGSIEAVKGSTLTVKGATGTTTVTVSAKTQIAKTLKVTASALATSLCAFVRGTSKDKGVTVTATDVALSKPIAGRCGFAQRRRPGTH